MKRWQRQILTFARQHPNEARTTYCRWVEPKRIHPDTLRKALKRDPEFREAFENARAGTVASDVADFERFLRHPDLLGLGVKYQDDGGTVLPNVLREAKAIVEGNYAVVLMTGSLGSGKTYTSALCLVYLTYRLLSEASPHERLGLDPNTSIVVGVQS